MSALLSPVELEQATQGPQLRPVGERSGRLGSVPFLMILALLLGAGMLGLLVLSTNIQDRAAQLRELQHQNTALGYQESALRAEADALESTTLLAQRAADLGMVPNPSWLFLTLPDGSVTGQAKQVTGAELPAQRETLPAAITREQARARVEAAAAALAAERAAQQQAAEQRAAAERAAAAEEVATEQVGSPDDQAQPSPQPQVAEPSGAAQPEQATQPSDTGNMAQPNQEAAQGGAR